MGLTDANQPLYAGPQGISIFDGFAENWLIENNVIFCSTYHGIALYGATNCTIINNTVLPDPLDTGGVTPWNLHHRAQESSRRHGVAHQEFGQRDPQQHLRARADAHGERGRGGPQHRHDRVSEIFTDFMRFDATLLAAPPPSMAAS